jgi:DNA-binding ferritin-like protein
MLMFLLAGHQIAVRTAYSVIEAATKVNDQPTINLVTENIYYHEKVMWQVRACLSKEAHETMSD